MTRSAKGIFFIVAIFGLSLLVLIYISLGKVARTVEFFHEFVSVRENVIIWNGAVVGPAIPGTQIESMAESLKNSSSQYRELDKTKKLLLFNLNESHNIKVFYDDEDKYVYSFISSNRSINEGNRSPFEIEMDIIYYKICSYYKKFGTGIHSKSNDSNGFKKESVVYNFTNGSIRLVRSEGNDGISVGVSVEWK